MKIGYADARGRKGGQRQGMTKEAEKKTILAESYYKCEYWVKRCNEIEQLLRLQKYVTLMRSYF